MHLCSDIVASLWGQREECGGLNGIGSHTLIRSGTITRYGICRSGRGIVAGSASFEGNGFDVSYAQDTIQCLS